MESEMTVTLETGMEATLHVTPSSGKEVTGWITFMKAYASWCKSKEGKDAGVTYNAKEVGRLWKALPVDQQAIWSHAGGKEKKGRSRSTSPKARDTDTSGAPHLNCSSFFHKLVSHWSNPNKTKGHTMDMAKRSQLWNVEKTNDVAKKYWTEALKVWREEDSPEDLAQFLENHPEYVKKIEELLRIVESPQAN